MTKPLLLHYYITNRCNSRCTFCSIWQENPKHDAVPEQVEANLVAARQCGCRFVDFTGGEPLLHPALPLFLRQAKRMGYTTSVTTNAILFAQRATELAGLVDLLHFSIDADTAPRHDILHGTPSFNKVCAAIEPALANGLVPDLLFTYSDNNIDCLEGVFRIARRHRIILIIDPLFSTDGTADSVSQQTHYQAARFARKPGVYLNRAHLLLRAQGGNHTSRPLCRAVTSTLIILPQNRLALPCYHQATSTLPIQQSLSATLDHPEYREAKKLQGKFPFCENCHINCYFDPSYTFLPGRFWFLSMAAKLKYGFYKYGVYGHPLPWLHRCKEKFPS